MNEVTKMQFKRYKYQDKIYSEKQWFSMLSNFRVFNEEQITLKHYMPNLDLAYIKDIFVDNVNKSTFSGLFLPCVVFLGCSLVNTLVQLILQYKLKLTEYENIFVFMIALSICYFIFGLIFLIKLIKKDKLVYYAYRYRYLNYQEYQDKMRIFNMHQYIYFKPLITNRLIIREFNRNDIYDYYKFASSEKVCQHLNVDVINCLEEAKMRINRVENEYHDQQIFKLAIMVKENSQVIGYIGLSKFDLSDESCQLVYAIHEDYWGGGYVTEAVSAFVKYLKTIGKKLIIAGHVKENMASGKVLLKNGFTRDHKRDYQMSIHGELKDILSYSIDERKNV